MAVRLVSPPLSPLSVESNETVHAACPVCHYLTIRYQGVFEPCVVCGWEESEDDKRENDALGGPNKDYSVKEARENFRKYLYGVEQDE